MALIKDFEKQVPGLAAPVVVPGAYWAIQSINGDKTELHCTVVVKERADADGTIGQLAFYFTPDAGADNYHAQAYRHLKTLDAFAGAQDG